MLTTLLLCLLPQSPIAAGPVVAAGNVIDHEDYGIPNVKAGALFEQVPSAPLQGVGVTPAPGAR